MKGSMRGSLDEQIREQQYRHFVDSNTQQKEEYLKEKGIILGWSYVGHYEKSSKRIIINDLINPFTNKTIHAIATNNKDLTDEFPLIVKLWIKKKLGNVGAEDVFCADVIGGILDNEKAIQVGNIIKNAKETEKKLLRLRGDMVVLNKELLDCKSALKEERAYRDKSIKQRQDYNELHNRYKAVCESNKKIRNENKSLSLIVENNSKEISHLEVSLRQEKDAKYSYYQEIDRLTIKIKNIGEWYKLVDHLRKTYNFEGFVHYTAYDNLKSIMTSGYILSRRDMFRNRIDLFDVAEEGVLQDTPSSVKDKVRLLYGFNTPISYRFEERAKERNTEMVALVIDPSIFLDYQLWFFEKSAARSSYGNPVTSVTDLQYFKWGEIFERGWYTPDQTYKKKYRDAEVVLSGRLSTKYITKVYFRSERYLNRAIAEIGEDSRFVIGRISDNDGQFTSGV